MQGNYLDELTTISRTINGSTSLKKILSLVAKETALILGVSRVVIFLKVKHQNQAKIMGEFDVHKKRRSEIGQTHSLRKHLHPISYRLMKEGKETQITNTESLGTTLPPLALQVLKKSQAKAFLGIPLKYQKQIVGALVIDDTQKPRRFTPQEIAVARTLANQSAAAIAKAQTLTTIKSLKNQLAELSASLLGKNLFVEIIKHAKNDRHIIVKPHLETLTVLIADLHRSSSFVKHQPVVIVAQMFEDFYELTQAVCAHWKGYFNEVKGDEVLAYFRSADDALNAALAMKIQMQLFKKKYGLDMRLGIHTGPVLVGFLETVERRFYSLTGKTVYLASRLQSLADPGKVLVSDRTRRSLNGTQNDYQFSPLKQGQSKESRLRYFELSAGQLSKKRSNKRD